MIFYLSDDKSLTEFWTKWAKAHLVKRMEFLKNWNSGGKKRKIETVYMA